LALEGLKQSVTFLEGNPVYLFYVLFLFSFQSQLDEELLQFLVAVVDDELLE